MFVDRDCAFVQSGNYEIQEAFATESFVKNSIQILKELNSEIRNYITSNRALEEEVMRENYVKENKELKDQIDQQKDQIDQQNERIKQQDECIDRNLFIRDILKYKKENISKFSNCDEITKPKKESQESYKFSKRLKGKEWVYLKGLLSDKQKKVEIVEQYFKDLSKENAKFDDESFDEELL